MSIDWSKAPDGATHWEPSGPEFNEGWMKKEGDYWFYWVEGINKWSHGPSCNVSADREATFEARPQEAWDGQGLPPVGVTCEYMNGSGHWHQVRITGHAELGLCFRVPGRDGENYVHRDCKFRPLPTPEQIAADEREKAIEEMCFAEETLTVKQAKALYEAGYRRQESST
ncbi:TPA: hypothetical protein L5R00_005965 [Pseudomonas aeruginosa]|nr:hypothetical protein [Pseudomonas aeruginosa]